MLTQTEREYFRFLGVCWFGYRHLVHGPADLLFKVTV